MKQNQPIKKRPILHVPILGAVISFLYAFVIRPWFLKWGTRSEEITHVFPGDEIIPVPKSQSTRAVSIAAKPEKVWPWLAQIGYQRAGWYSYDFLEGLMGVADFIDEGSANRIIPELQQLKPGDVIRTDPGGGLTVIQMEPNRFLVLEAYISITGQHAELDASNRNEMMHCSWGFYLDQEGGSTRLLARFRCTYPPSIQYELFTRLLLEPAVFLMERKMLLGIKERAEVYSPKA